MMSLKNIRLLTFDVHNVLLTVRNGAVSHYARLAREHLNLQSTDETLLRSKFIQAFRGLNRTHPGYGITRSISSRQWWSMLVEQTFQDYRLSSSDVQALSTIIYDEFAKGELWVKHPEADQVLRELHQRKRLGVISNFDERLESLLEQHQLRSYFQFVLTPRTCGMYKPQLEIFSHAGQLAKIQSKEELCHIGDDVELDYRAARANDNRCLLLVKDDQAKETLLHEHPNIPRDHVITHLTDLLSLIE